MRGSSAPGEIDFSLLADITASFAVEYARTSFHKNDSVLYADVAVKNTGRYPVDAPLYVAIANLSDPTVRPLEAAGLTPEGLPYYNVSKRVPDGRLGPDGRTDSFSFAFANPHEVRFTYDLVFFGLLNRAPIVETVPVVEASAGRPYRYDVEATDPDGDPLSYQLVTGPEGMTIDPATGAIAWTPGEDVLGNHAVTVRVEDGRGGFAEQRFDVSVIVAPPNRPPVFTSLPVATSFVGQPYTYDADATDPDGDVLHYALVAPIPAGMAIDEPTGLISWTPTPDQQGEVDVTVEVTDGQGGTAQQTYAICVLEDPADHAPVIVSQPVVTLVVPSPEQASGGSIFLTGHDPDFHALVGGNHAGAADITKAAIHFVMDPAYNPFVAQGISKFLFVESTGTPPVGHVHGVNGLIASGFKLGIDFDLSDASTLNAALVQLGTTYGALVIASDFGGILTQAELDILNARSADIIAFLNAGGGLYAMAESDNGAHLTPKAVNSITCRSSSRASPSTRRRSETRSRPTGSASAWLTAISTGTHHITFSRATSGSTSWTATARATSCRWPGGAGSPKVASAHGTTITSKPSMLIPPTP